MLKAFAVRGVLGFPTDGLAPACAAFGKCHPRQDEHLQFGRRNWMAILTQPARFRDLGLRIWTPPSS